MKNPFIVLLIMLTVPSVHAQNQKEKHLQEVTVIASRIADNAEGYTANLQGMDIAKGKPAADVLQFLPNISRENGTLKINGLAVSEVYVNGVKLTDLSELNNIQGEMIDKVQVKYLAGADQKASVSGGSIMITLRRPPQGGYYGSITANADWYRSCGFGNVGSGGVINYRHKNLSVYDNLYLNHSKFEENALQWLDGSNSHVSLSEITKSKGFDFRNRLSLTQQFKSGAQLGGSYLIATSCPKPASLSVQEHSITAIDKRINTTVQEGTLKFHLPLSQKGAAMEFTADYFNRHSSENADYAAEGEIVGATSNSDNLNLWKLKADFIYPRSRSLSWKFGGSAQWISSTFTPSVILESDRFNVSDIPTATSGFTPIIYAAAQGAFWKMRYSAGVNWQLNRITYHDKNAHVRNRNTQWAINPKVQFMMPFGQKMNHAVMLNYSHELNDIPYSAITSVVNWIDASNYTVGNPDLKAQSAHIVMAALSLFRNKINVNALYARADNRIYWQTFQSSENPEVFYTKPINISGQTLWGIGAEWLENPVRWWRFKVAGRVEITPENAVIANIHYGSTRLKEYFSFNNNFTFPHGWGGMLNVNYEPTFHSLDRTYHAVYGVNGQLYKLFFNGDIQIALDFTPAARRRKLDRMAGASKVSYSYTTPVQYFGLSFVWNFSGGKKVDVNVTEGIQDYHETRDSR